VPPLLEPPLDPPPYSVGAHAWICVVDPGSTIGAHVCPSGQLCLSSQNATHVPVDGRQISLSPQVVAPCVGVHASPTFAAPLVVHT